jgi:hypothetical protein
LKPELIWLLRVQPRNPATGAEIAVRLAGGGTRGYSQFGGAAWWAGLERPSAIVQRLGFNDGEFGEGAIVQALELRWGGTAKRASILASYYWPDAKFTLHYGPDGGVDAEFTQVLAGRIADVSAVQGRVTLQMADPSKDLERPVLGTATFAGTGGIEGIVELKGRPKRRAVGRCRNVELWSLDPANNIWVATDPARPLFAIDQLYDRGNAAASLVQVAWAGTVAATLAALAAAVCPQGGGAVAPSIGCIKWWFANPGKLTCDLRGEIGGAYFDRPADIAAWAVAAVNGPVVNAASLIAARALRNFEAGRLVSGDETAGGILNDVLNGVSLWWGMTSAGELEFGAWAFGASVGTIIGAVATRSQSHKPVKKLTLGYRRNYTVISRSEIAASVLDDSSVLTIAEKTNILKPKEERREIEYTDWTTRATALATAALTTAIGSVNAKRTAWLALRNAIAPAWNNIAANSPINRTAYDIADRDYDDMLSWLKTLISEEDARRASWPNVDGVGRPESNATAADNIIVNGSLSDGTRGFYLNPSVSANFPRVTGVAGEPGAYFRATGTTDIRCNDAQPILGAFGNARCYLNMTSFVPDRSMQSSYYQIWEYDAAGGLLVNPPADMTPPVAGVFQNVRKAFQFHPNTARIVIFVGATGATVGNPVKFGDFRVSFTERDADVTITAQVTTLPPPDIAINATYTGVIITSPAQFNKVVTPSVLSGGVSVRTDARATYTVTDVSSGLSGSVSVNSTAGSADKGRVTVTNATSSGTFKLNIFWSGVQIATHVVALSVVPADPPSGGGGSGGGGGAAKTGEASVSGWGTSSTAFIEVARVSSLTKAAGETIKCALAAAGYSLAHNSSSNRFRFMLVKFQYSVAGANSWTDMDVAVSGSNANFDGTEFYGDPGYVTCNQTVAPANAVYDLRLIAAISATGGTLTFDYGHSFSVVIEP